MPDHDRAHRPALDRPRPTEPRLSPLDPAAVDDETAALLGDAPLNIFATLAHHPKLLKRWLVFGNHVLSKSSLPARERELVILRTGANCASVYEFGQHTVIGDRCGLTPEEIGALVEPVEAGNWSPSDAALVRAADELHADQCLSDETWTVLAETWDDQQILDLVFAVGQYTIVSMALNSLGVQRDEGVPGWPD